MDREQLQLITPLIAEFFKCLRFLHVEGADLILDEIAEKLNDFEVSFKNFKDTIEKASGETIPEGDPFFSKLKEKMK